MSRAVRTQQYARRHSHIIFVYSRKTAFIEVAAAPRREGRLLVMPPLRQGHADIDIVAH